MNRLSLNVDKTKYIMFTKKRNFANLNMTINIENQCIAKTNQTKFLGIIIDDKLTWKPHLLYLTGKVSRSIGIISKTMHILDKDCLKILYFALVYPYLTYCNQVWGSTYPTNLNRLQLLQKKVIRIISRSGYLSHTGDLFSSLGLLTIANINVYLTGCFMFRLHHGLSLDIFDNFFVSNYDIHDYSTRSSSLLHTPKIKSNLSKSGIRYHGARIWNDILKSDLNINVSESSFKIAFKKYLL